MHSKFVGHSTEIIRQSKIKGPLEIINNEKCRICIFILFLERHNDFVMGLRDLLHNDLRGFNFDSNLTSDPLWADYWANHVDLPRIREGRLGGQVSSK